MDKPFALFGGDEFYPGGGFDDFRGTFATLDEAVSHGNLVLLDDETATYTREVDWYHVVDLRIMRIVARRDRT